MTLFRQFIARALRRDPARGLVTVAGLTLGVAVVVAIRLANTASVRGFESALDVVAGRTSLEIVGAGVGVPEDQLAGMGWLRQYGRVSPVIDRNARLETTDGAGHRLRVLGVDVLRDRPFREYQLLRFSRQGRAPRPQELLDVLLDSTSIVLTERFARRHGIAVGAPVRLVAGDAVHEMVVRGLLLDEGPARVVDGRLALLDIAAAQWRFDGLGWVDRVEIQLFEAAAIDDVEGAIAARLPAGLRVQRPAQRGRQVERMLAAFHFNLSALSWIALVVGLFLVYNTVAVSVISRRAEIGVLRALGATRRLVLGLFLGEAAVLAALAAALGAPVGWGLARAAVALTSTTVNTLYVTSQAVVPPLGAPDLVLAAAVAIPLALIAAAMPAAEAAGVTPIAAVRPPDGGTDRGRFPRRAAFLAAGLFAAGGCLSTLDAVGGLPVFGLGRRSPSSSGRRRWCRCCWRGCVAGAARSSPAGSASRACWPTRTCPRRCPGWPSRWRRSSSASPCSRPSRSWSAAFARPWPTGSDRPCRRISSSPSRTEGRSAHPRAFPRRLSAGSRRIQPWPRWTDSAPSTCRTAPTET